MRKEIYLVLALLLAAGLIVHCGGNGGLDIPSLEGTWGGSGWVDPGVFGPRAAQLGAEPLVVCPTAEGFAPLELETDEEGNPNDLLVCGQSIQSIIGTFTAEVDQADFEENVLFVVFTTSATGDTVFTGGLVLDNSFDYAVLFLWDEAGDDVLSGVLQRSDTPVPVGARAELLAFSEAGLEGSWSGFVVDFEDDGEFIYYEKNSPLDVTLTVDNSLSLTGTDPDGLSLIGTLNLVDAVYGAVAGTIQAFLPPGVTAEPEILIDFTVEGFQSPDGQFFGAQSYSEFFPFEWSIIALRLQD
jgi:hypothetical protein